MRKKAQKIKLVFCLSILAAVQLIAYGKASANQDIEKSCFPESKTNSEAAEILSCITDFLELSVDDNSESTLPSASYALGATFQRDLAARFTELDYGQFLLGLQAQASGTMQYSDKKLSTALENIILSERERSDKFVKAFSKKSGVQALKGIYYIDRTGSYLNEESIQAEENPNVRVADAHAKQNPSCPEQEAGEKKFKYVVEYRLLKLDESMPESDESFTCLSVNEAEVIRGWRTALRTMDKGDLWELVIPATLAYGDEGVDNENQNIAAGEALRFLIRLTDKS